MFFFQRAFFRCSKACPTASGHDAHKGRAPHQQGRRALVRSGALRGRGCPLERCAARVCREVGARVTCNTRLADMNLTGRPSRRGLKLLPTACRFGMASCLLSTPPSCRPCLARECPTSAVDGTQAQRWLWRAAARNEHSQSFCGQIAAAWLSSLWRLEGAGSRKRHPLCAPLPAPRHGKRCAALGQCGSFLGCPVVRSLGALSHDSLPTQGSLRPSERGEGGDASREAPGTSRKSKPRQGKLAQW